MQKSALSKFGTPITVLSIVFLSLLVACEQPGGSTGKDIAGQTTYATALRELRPLAEQGHAKSQYKLGIMYRDGRGVPQDYAEAVKWYRKAAVQGFASAQVALGFMYRKGRGVPQDYAETAKWYRRAADQGHAMAQNNLGVMYRDGWEVPQDYVRAHMWCSLSAAQGHKKAAKLCDAVAKSMTSAQIAEAQRMVREWKPKKE